MSERSQARMPFHIMAKPIGARCNIDCKYCFYLEKEALYGDADGSAPRMSDETLERFVRQYIEAQPTAEVHFAWQGGEPTLLGVDFFKRAVELQKKYANGKTIHNAFQTNGILVDDEWADFFAENAFLIGLSLDGPERLHNEYRVTRNGKPTFHLVMRGLEALKAKGVEFNTLTCVNRKTAKSPLDVYRFLKNAGARHMQFIPIVERRAGGLADKHGLTLAIPPGSEEGDLEAAVTGWSVRPEDFGSFYIKIFDKWVRKDVGSVYVQMFETALARWAGLPAGICVHEETCGRALAIENDGSLYSCDHYVYSANRLGDIADRTLAEMADSDKQRRFGEHKKAALPDYCRRCDVRFVCNGGCPKDRILQTPDGDPGLNWLCRGYKDFFHHIDPCMRAMADLWRRGQPVSLIMEMIRQKRIKGV